MTAGYRGRRRGPSLLQQLLKRMPHRDADRVPVHTGATEAYADVLHDLAASSPAPTTPVDAVIPVPVPRPAGRHCRANTGPYVPPVIPDHLVSLAAYTAHRTATDETTLLTAVTDEVTTR